MRIRTWSQKRRSEIQLGMQIRVQLVNFGQVKVNSLLNKVNYFTMFARDCKLNVIAESESLFIVLSLSLLLWMVTQ